MLILEKIRSERAILMTLNSTIFRMFTPSQIVASHGNTRISAIYGCNGEIHVARVEGTVFYGDSSYISAHRALPNWDLGPCDGNCGKMTHGYFSSK
jgi:hypothetical protein